MKFLTFDIEDYHHLLDLPGIEGQYVQSQSVVGDFVDELLPLLREHSITAIFFVLGEIADQFPSAVKKIADEGHVIGTHSFAHKMLSEQSDEEFMDDLLSSIKVIESVSGVDVRCYRAPGFSMTSDHFHRYSLLAKAGIRFDFSLFDGKASHGGVEISGRDLPIRFDTDAGQITSFPFMRSKVFSSSLPLMGGGYFRITPYALVQKVVRESEYAMTYFHPRDFSYYQPRLKGLSPVRYFKAYAGIKGGLRKLQKLIASDEWAGGSLIQMELKKCTN